MSEILSWVKFRGKKKGGDILTEHKHKLYKVDKGFKIWSLHSSKYLRTYHVYIELFNTRPLLVLNNLKVGFP